MRIIFFLSIVLLNENLIFGKLTVTPEDTFVALGSKAIFHCSTDVDVDEDGPPNWEVDPVGEAGSDYIYESGQLYKPEKYRIEKNKSIGQYDLVIRKVELSDAGNYKCHDEAGISTAHRVHAELTVLLDPSPTCTSNISKDGSLGENNCNLAPDYVQFNCSVVYRGNKAPEIEWQPSTENNDVINFGVSSQTSYNSATSSVVLQSSLSINGTYLICRIKNGVQSFQGEIYSCNTTTMNVLYAFNSSESYIVSSDGQECSVNTSSLQCKYQWVAVHDPRILNLRDNSGNDKYQCLAECELSGRSCVVTGQRLEILGLGMQYTKTIENNNFVLIIGFIVGSIVATMLVSMMVLVWKYKSKLWKTIIKAMPCRRKTESTPEEERGLMSPSDNDNIPEVVIHQNSVPVPAVTAAPESNSGLLVSSVFTHKDAVPVQDVIAAPEVSIFQEPPETLQNKIVEKRDVLMINITLKMQTDKLESLLFHLLVGYRDRESLQRRCCITKDQVHFIRNVLKELIQANLIGESFSCGIQIFFQFLTSNSLLKLKSLHESGRLKEMFEQIFQCLLKLPPDSDSLIESITINEEQFKRCLADSHHIRNIEEFPIELLEIFLYKSAFVYWAKLAANTDSLASLSLANNATKAYKKIKNLIFDNLSNVIVQLLPICDKWLINDLAQKRFKRRVRLCISVRMIRPIHVHERLNTNKIFLDKLETRSLITIEEKEEFLQNERVSREEFSNKYSKENNENWQKHNQQIVNWNEKFLKCLHRKRFSDFLRFLKSMEETYQSHLLNYIIVRAQNYSLSSDALDAINNSESILYNEGL